MQLQLADVQRALNEIGLDICNRNSLKQFLQANYTPFIDDQQFTPVFHQVKEHTLVDIIRLYDLYSLTLETAKLPPGHYCEVGVWRGGSAAIIGRAAKHCAPGAHLSLFDTFEGVVKAGEHDTFYKGGEHEDASADVVDELLKTIGLTDYSIHQGVFPDDTADQARTPLRMVHIDVDVYEGAKGVAEWALPHLVPGGLLVFDDYGFNECAGVIKLVHELRERDDLFFMYNANGHGVLIKR